MSSTDYTNKEKVMQKLKEELNISKDKLDRVASVVMEEAKSDEGNPDKLIQSIKNGAKSILADIGLETVSWVQNPSQDSMFVMMKNSDTVIQKSSSIYKEPEDDWQTVYGPVMRPNDIDKDGDSAPASQIKDAAHNFMAEGRVKQFDTDHDLNTGKGTMVESWILKEDKEYELPNGETELIEKGTWMVGVQPNEEIRKKIESGEITGWSIFGQADQIQLKNKAKVKNFNNDSQVNTFKEDTMSNEQDTQNKEQEGESVTMKEMQSQISEMHETMKEYMESPEPTTVKSVEELENTLKSDENTLIELSEDFTLEKEESTSKEEDFEDMDALLSYLQDMLSSSNFSMLQEMMKEYDDKEDEDEEEKTAKSKGSNGEGTRTVQNKVRKGESKDKGVSFQKVADNFKEESA